MKRAFAFLATVLVLAGCYREQRPVKAPPAASGVADRSYAAREDTAVVNRYEENAFAVSQGKTWFRAYNCNGCHASGGGNSGPALMDATWRYGSDPASIFTSIAAGRPNGMPAFGKRVPEDQIWQLVAYVRSMSGQLSGSVAPSRSDSLYPGEPESRREPEQPKGEAPPAER
ncbi:c-type cytochrome [Massilia sp. 9I]|uniref:c-type cytochrome n=1 Tax=Massilia sp. 9I TaxID=2653152 RepID=UPI0012F43D5F|nr:c-type cytochrome [Massilia sp. 9I]VXB95140.1 Cytochrome c oxidase polypeptide III [Massilia sp. 9I]